jgi:hypothetical protein
METKVHCDTVALASLFGLTVSEFDAVILVLKSSRKEASSAQPLGSQTNIAN